MRLAGIIINSYVADTASQAEETNPAAIERASGLKVLAVVPRDLQTNEHKGIIGPGVLFALRQAATEYRPAAALPALRLVKQDSQTQAA